MQWCLQLRTLVSSGQAFFPALYQPGLEWGNATLNFLSLPGNLLLNLFILFPGQNNSFSHYHFYCSPGTLLKLPLKLCGWKCDAWFTLEPWLLSWSPKIGSAGTWGHRVRGGPQSSAFQVASHQITTWLFSMPLRLKKVPARLSLAGYVHPGCTDSMG